MTTILMYFWTNQVKYLCDFLFFCQFESSFFSVSRKIQWCWALKEITIHMLGLQLSTCWILFFFYLFRWWSRFTNFIYNIVKVLPVPQYIRKNHLKLLEDSSKQFWSRNFLLTITFFHLHLNFCKPQKSSTTTSEN